MLEIPFFGFSADSSIAKLVVFSWLSLEAPFGTKTILVGFSFDSTFIFLAPLGTLLFGGIAFKPFTLGTKLTFGGTTFGTLIFADSLGFCDAALTSCLLVDSTLLVGTTFGTSGFLGTPTLGGVNLVFSGFADSLLFGASGLLEAMFRGTSTLSGLIISTFFVSFFLRSVPNNCDFKASYSVLSIRPLSNSSLSSFNFSSLSDIFYII